MKKNYASFKKLLKLEEGARDIYANFLKKIKEKEFAKDIAHVRREEIEHVSSVLELFDILGKSNKKYNKTRRKKSVFTNNIEERKKLINFTAKILESKLRLISLLEKSDAFNQRLKGLNKIKSEFVSVAAHQIKNPLTSMRWLVELLAKESKLNTKQKEYIKIFYSSNKKLVNLVEDLLKISRLEEKAAGEKMEKINITELFRNTIKKYRPAITEKKLSVVLTSPKAAVRIKSSIGLLENIIDNLFSNAVKYTLQKGKINIDFKSSGKDLLVSVADNGIGIPEEAGINIFERFYRAENAKKEDEEGSGLGLSIVLDSVKRLGGKVWFEPNFPKGTIFYLLLPQKL